MERIMFWLKTIFTAVSISLVISVFFLIKDKIILKREMVFNLQQNNSKDKISVINLLLAFLIVSLAMFSLYFTLNIFKIWNSDDVLFLITRITGYIFIGLIYFMMIYHHKVDRYRRFLFLLFAIGFTIDFVCDLYEARSHFYFLSQENIIQSELPKCHVGIMQSLIPLLLKGEYFAPGKLIYNGIGVTYTVGSVIILWIAISLALGRGWCSWACFWGGWDNGFSTIKKKPVIKKINQKLKWVPFALLIVVLITSFLSIAPLYCWWICPFKAVSEAPKIISPIVLIQTIVFVVVFLSLVVVLPILTKKRTHCGFFCPFGAFQSIVDKVNIFRVRIDKDKCINCKKCIQECPVSSITEKSLEKGNAGFTCTKCGKCIDICPQNAISYHIKGMPKKGKIAEVLSFVSRYAFLLIAFIFFGTMGGGEIIDGFNRILLFITTGSFIK
jgi:NAD-dependent dihydropyrimidine dehydrogenase PreA subunit